MEESSAKRLILIVEDNPDQARLIENTLNGNSARYQIVTIANGEQALNFLHRRLDYRDAPRPDLILLDLNLSGKNGREVLAEIKTDPQLRRIPIVILTLSATEEDILKTYTLQGNSYVIKSSNSEELSRVVKRIEEFWLEIVTLPGE
jgi:two-component system, chemotaxis family, response regulator Rcp1